ncbi:uncharacterized mitochondrial protein AtMg00810-like [Juglans microcarpa x Juglans regia]|uniref:uncharacterized mitochondrial protein AtMg00810-like n=1 Tax=Juglans microcarpa x Juglans regia TaxID=2249226 RepID=UPI001B7EF4C7|nr:uncharacterized mitochondrial protein AtMg00810-like [Juglans microcarpa x Juglans regia]
MELVNVVVDDNSKEMAKNELNNLIGKAEENSTDQEDLDLMEPATPSSVSHHEKESSKNSTGKSIDPTLYRSMIGSLLYITASRPDIAFSVGVCARYQANPKESHLTTVKRILKYLSATVDYGIWYSKDSNLNLVGYSDAAEC